MAEIADADRARGHVQGHVALCGRDPEERGPAGILQGLVRPVLSP